MIQYIKDLLKGQNAPSELAKKVESLNESRKVSTQLAMMRHKAGLTAKKMSLFLGSTPERVLRLEAGKDSEITANYIKKYVKFTRQKFTLDYD